LNVSTPAAESLAVEGETLAVSVVLEIVAPVVRFSL
jgi:hypothetical protein